MHFVESKYVFFLNDKIDSKISELSPVPTLNKLERTYKLIAKHARQQGTTMLP
jgi:hypothetical protein